MNDRIIIGEVERGGWPISAPIKKDAGICTMRWVPIRGGAYTLEHYVPYQGWLEVPFIQPDNDDANLLTK